MAHVQFITYNQTTCESLDKHTMRERENLLLARMVPVCGWRYVLFFFSFYSLLCRTLISFFTKKKMNCNGKIGAKDRYAPNGIRNGGSLIRREISGGLEVRRRIGNIGWVVIDGDGSVRILLFFSFIYLSFSRFILNLRSDSSFYVILNTETNLIFLFFLF